MGALSMLGMATGAQEGLETLLARKIAEQKWQEELRKQQVEEAHRTRGLDIQEGQHKMQAESNRLSQEGLRLYREGQLKARGEEGTETKRHYGELEKVATQRAGDYSRAVTSGASIARDYQNLRDLAEQFKQYTQDPSYVAWQSYVRELEEVRGKSAAEQEAYLNTIPGALRESVKRFLGFGATRAPGAPAPPLFSPRPPGTPPRPQGIAPTAPGLRRQGERQRGLIIEPER